MIMRSRLAALATVVTAVITFAVPAQALTAQWALEAAPAPTVRQAGFDAVDCPVVAACVVVGHYVASDAREAPFANIESATGWRGSRVAIPAGASGYSTFDDVSCVSTTMCMGVGFYADAVPPATSALAEIWNGTRWRQIPTRSGDSRLEHVSCPAANLCFAIAQTPSYQLEMWNGATWSVVWADAPTTDLFDVDCPSADSCVAVGSGIQPGHSVHQPLAVTFDSTGWAAHYLAVPGTNPTGSLLGVSCPSPGSCMAVGGYSGGFLAESGSGASWVPVATVAGFTGPETVSCVTSTDCTAAEYTRGAAPLVADWDGSSWSRAASPPNDSAFGGDQSGVAIACPDAQTCVLAAAPSGRAYLAERNGTGWHRADAVVVRAPLAAYLTADSCVQSVCAAVGAVNDIRQQPLVSWRSGGTWTTTELSLAEPNVNGLLEDVSCATPTACVAVGLLYSSDGTTNHALSEVWDGQSWRELVLPPSPQLAIPLTSVACPAANDCIAVGTDGNWTSGPILEQFDGQQWTQVSVPGQRKIRRLSHIACTGPANCVILGTELVGTTAKPFAAVWSGGTFAFHYLDTELILTDVACPTVRSCHAVGYTTAYPYLPAVEDWDGASWTTTMLPAPSGADTEVLGVSCRSSRDCLAVGTSSVTAGETRTAVGYAWDGTDWTPSADPAPPANSNLWRLTGVSAAGTGYVASGDFDRAISQPLVESYT